MKRHLAFFTVGTVCLFYVLALADFPHVLNYQGRLDNAAGDPLPDGNYEVTFRLFNVPADGSSLWNETQTVTTVEGVFSVLLGSVDSIPEFVYYQDSAYLEIQPTGSSPVAPRTRLTVVPYAMRARNADLLEGITATGLEESNEIQQAITAHTAIPDAHHEKTVDASELVLGTLAEGRLPQHAIDSTEIEVASIAADRLADEPGLAYSNINLSLLAPDPAVTAIDSVSLTVPKAGFMIVQASGWFYKLHTTGTGDSYATVSLSVLRTAHGESHTVKFAVLNAEPSGHHSDNFALTRVLSIGAGTTKLYLIGSYNGTMGPRVEQVHISAMYFPTAYGNVDNVLSE